MAARSVPQLWPHQADAVDAVLSAIGDGGRTTVVAACGVGKTRIGGTVAYRLGVRRALVVMPTIELLAQTLRTYRSVCGPQLGVVVAVCSDPMVADLRDLTDGLQVLVTTSPETLARVTHEQRQVTVLSTYASLQTVRAAHADYGLSQWDVVIADEAHRTTGAADGPWKAAHYDTLIPSRRRLYMTATPRISASSGTPVVSMNDESVYGRVCYRLPFSAAIEQGLLADYRVVVPVVTDRDAQQWTATTRLALRLGRSEVPPSVLAGQVAVLKAMAEFGVRRAISFHHRIADARQWTSLLPRAARLLPQPAPVWAGYVSGAQTPNERRQVVARLAAPGPGLVVVGNAKVLSEGVDVPAVDGVLFAQARQSPVDTIQAVGRALRLDGRPGKVATIVIPMPVAAGTDLQAMLETSAWEPVWQVVRALRDHDDRLEAHLTMLRTQIGTNPARNTFRTAATPLPWLHIRGQEDSATFAAAITVQAVLATSTAWDVYLAAADAFHTDHGHLHVPQSWICGAGIALGRWIDRQRKAYRDGVLTPVQICVLEQVGMVWEPLNLEWETGLDHARQFRTEQGHLQVPSSYRTSDGFALGTWIGNLRRTFRRGKLPDDKTLVLQQLDMVWEPRHQRWEQGLQHARAYYNQHAHLRVPAQYVTADGFRLGAWIGQQRAGHATGSLTCQQTEQLEQVRMPWQPRRDPWHDTYTALAAFHQEHGHFEVLRQHLTERGISLGKWASTQRLHRASGRLTTERIALLEAIGFPWDPGHDQWMHRLKQVRSRVHQHGPHLPAGTSERYWLDKQRSKHRRGELRPEQLALLHAAGLFEP